MTKVIGHLKGICPSLTHIKLDKKYAEAFPDLLQVLEYHSQSCDYMIQFFKEPRVDCTPKACINNRFKHVRMPRQVYERFLAFPMPMPILKPIGVFDKEADVEYMSFTDALKLPFTNAHQPSLAVTTLRAASKKKKIVVSR